MTVADGMYQAEYLPPSVTRVKKEVIKSFSHSKRVGGYLLGRTLGVGSFAKVKEGLHLTTGEKVAVKVIDKKRAKTDNYVRKNLRREGRLLQMVRHPNVVALFEVMETDNSYYLVTELCKGGDLMDYISSKKRLPEMEVTKFVRQIVSAVDYLHRLGIIHRDLKIENLLLDANKDIKLIDFGLSNSIKVATSGEDGGARAQEFCVTQCGSPAYAAPELLNHEKYGLQVDLWSIGVNMYAMLTGSLPFTVEPFNIKSLYAKMKDRQMNPVPDDLSKECRDLLKKFLDPDPKKRVTICEALAHPWLAYCNKQVPRAPCPNKLRTSDLEADILSHMAENLGFRMGEVIKFVTCNTPSPASATYHLLLARLTKYMTELKRSGGDPSLDTHGRGRDGKITLHLQDIRRRPHHQGVSRQSSQPSTPVQRSRGQSARTDHSDSPASRLTNRKRGDSGPDDSPTRSPSPDRAPSEMTSRADSKAGQVTSRFPARTAQRRPVGQETVLPKANAHIGRQGSLDTPNPILEKLQDNGQTSKAQGPVSHRPAVPKERGNPADMLAPGGQGQRVEHPAETRLAELPPTPDASNGGPSNALRYVMQQNLKNKQYQHRDTSVTHGESTSTTTPRFEPPVDYVISPRPQGVIHHTPNKLLVRRGLGQQSTEANMLPTTGLKTVFRGRTSESLPATQTQTPQPSTKHSTNVKRIVPKQYVPFRSAQDRMGRRDSLGSSRNAAVTSLEKSHTATEGMSLQGKTLMRPTGREEGVATAGALHKPMLVKRKLVKRHRMGDLTPPSGYVIQDVDQSLNTAIVSLDNREEKLSSPSPLPQISPTHATK